MHGDHHGTGRLGGTCQRHGIAVVGVDAGAHLDGDRYRHGLDHTLDDLDGQRFVAHQGGAGIDVADLLDRTAHVDVDDLRAALDVEAGGLGHHGGVGTGDLHRLGLDLAGMVDAARGLDAVPEPRVGGRHFRDGIACAQALAQLPVGAIGDAGHGGHQGPMRQRIRTDSQQRGLAGGGEGGGGGHCGRQCEGMTRERADGGAIHHCAGGGGAGAR